MLNAASLLAKRSIGERLIGDGDAKALWTLCVAFFPVYKYQYILIGGLIVLSSAATGLTAWLVRDVVDGLFVKHRLDLLLPVALSVFVAFFVRGIATYWQSLMSAQISNDLVARTQVKVLNHLFIQKIVFFDKYSSDDLSMRINNAASAFGTILNRVVLSGVRDAATVLSLVAVMITQDIVLTFICLLVVPPALFSIALLLKRVKSLIRDEMHSVSDLNMHVRETVQGIKVIKAYNLESAIQDKATQVIDRIKQRSNKVASLQNAPVPIIDTLGGCAVVMTILYAGYRSTYGNYEPGTLLSFVTSLLLAMDPARRLSQLRVSLKTALAGVEAIDELFLNNDPEDMGLKRTLPSCIPPSRKLDIDIAGLDFEYEGGGKILSDFSLTVKAGEVVAVVGPSGAGKSTLFALLLRLHQPQTGTIRMGGVDIGTMHPAEVRDLIGYVGQSNFIFRGTIKENLTLNRENIKHREIVDACKIVGLHDYITALPAGYDTAVGELGSLISGGQAQRLNIARAIIKDAPILLFDEVTSALDAENEELVRDYIKSQAGSKTVLIIAHRLSTIRQSDRIALLDGGRLRAFGTHADLLRNDGYYERIANLQLVA